MRSDRAEMLKLEAMGQSWPVMTFDLAHTVVSQKQIGERRKTHTRISSFFSYHFYFNIFEIEM